MNRNNNRNSDADADELLEIGVLSEFMQSDLDDAIKGKLMRIVIITFADDRETYIFTTLCSAVLNTINEYHAMCHIMTKAAMDYSTGGVDVRISSLAAQGDATAYQVINESGNVVGELGLMSDEIYQDNDSKSQALYMLKNGRKLVKPSHVAENTRHTLKKGMH